MRRPTTVSRSFTLSQGIARAPSSIAGSTTHYSFESAPEPSAPARKVRRCRLISSQRARVKLGQRLARRLGAFGHNGNRSFTVAAQEAVLPGVSRRLHRGGPRVRRSSRSCPTLQEYVSNF